MKTCTKCEESKDRDMFYKCKTAKDGLRSHCKVCHHAMSAKYYKKNSETIDTRNAKWQRDKPSKVKEIRRRWRESEGLCVYQATFPSGRYIGEGLTAKRRSEHLCGTSRIAKTIGEKANQFLVIYKGTKEQCRLTEKMLIDRIGLENLLNTMR